MTSSALELQKELERFPPVDVEVVSMAFGCVRQIT